MEIFINGTGIISPQNTFAGTALSIEAFQPATHAYLKCVEPDYKTYINPALLRRMSRMIKMGITSAKRCLEDAQVSMPGAIITGTGLGCIEDTEKFILSILENNEQLLTPTPFIQSTHNTVGGQIALLLGCHEYNYTYVHRGLSFESALLDAMMMLQEKSANNILVGGIDELTNNSFKLLQQLGIYSKAEMLDTTQSNKTPGGEGAAFFLLSDTKTTQSKAKITLLKTIAGETDSVSLENSIASSLKEKSKTIHDISLVLTGKSGNSNTDQIFKKLEKTIFKNSLTETFKQYCGEYHTASSFALWLAIEKINAGNSSVLICNHFAGADHSIMLIEKC